MGRKKKHRNQKINHRDAIHTIYGRVNPGSAADYLMLKKRFLKMDEDWMVRNFKKGDQLLFNTKFIQEIKDTHEELHCEICGKENLKLYMWWEHSKRWDMATADHFFPKSFDKERLSFERKNMIVACNDCNNRKADDFYGIHIVKHPYPGTIQNLAELQAEHNLRGLDDGRELKV